MQRMIKSDTEIMHPMMAETAPVLQYSDDTIILVRADLGSVQWLKQTLDNFSMCTCLKINVGKIDHGDAEACPALASPLQAFMDHLQCRQGFRHSGRQSRPLTGNMEGAPAEHGWESDLDQRGPGWASNLRHGALELLPGPWGRCCSGRTLDDELSSGRAQE